MTDVRVGDHRAPAGMLQRRHRDHHLPLGVVRRAPVGGLITVQPAGAHRGDPLDQCGRLRHSVVRRAAKGVEVVGRGSRHVRCIQHAGGSRFDPLAVDGDGSAFAIDHRDRIGERREYRGGGGIERHRGKGDGQRAGQQRRRHLQRNSVSGRARRNGRRPTHHEDVRHPLARGGGRCGKGAHVARHQLLEPGDVAGEAQHRSEMAQPLKAHTASLQIDLRVELTPCAAPGPEDAPDGVLLARPDDRIGRVQPSLQSIEERRAVRLSWKGGQQLVGQRCDRRRHVAARRQCFHHVMLASGHSRHRSGLEPPSSI